MGIADPTVDRKDSESAQKDSPQGGNVDSGYHSFTNVPSFYHPDKENNTEMITSLPHDADFPLPQKFSDYPIITSPMKPPRTTPQKYDNLYNVSPPVPPRGDADGVKEEMKKDAIAKDLADKVQFCLKLGFPPENIRKILKQIGPTASKNDLLKALGDSSSEVAATQAVNHEEAEGDLKAPGLVSRGPSTVEDESKESDPNDADNLRPIVIDGSNVAMSHGNKEYFSCKGIQIAVQYFLDRGHRDITVFVPTYRKEQTRPDAPIKDQEILTKLEADKILVCTPSRYVNGRRITCYDDRFIIKLAQVTQGVIVSNDNFRDLQNEKHEWKELIEKRLLMYSFVNDRFMAPDDPLGRNGPSLDNFLRIRSVTEVNKKPECPYGKKCTYGKKCKYFHPEFPLNSVTEDLNMLNADQLRKAREVQQITDDVINSKVREVQQITDDIRNSANSTGAHKNDRLSPNRKQEELQEPEMQRTRSARQTNSPHGAATYVSSQSSSPQLKAAINNTQANGYKNGSTPISNGYHHPHGAYPQYPTKSTDSNNNPPRSTGAPIPMPQHMGAMVPPPLHREYLDRDRQALSSLAPQRTHLAAQQMNIHHSSPSALPAYDRNASDLQNRPSVHPQFPMTYPSLPARQQPMIPQQAPPANPSYYPYPQFANEMMANMAAYHQQMMNSFIQMSFQNPPAPHMPRYSNYPYTQPHVMTPNHMPVPMPQSPYGPHSSPPMCHPNSMGPTKPQQLPPDQSYAEFKNAQSPRHNLYKNLCGLFNRNSVERVLLSHPKENDPKRLAKFCLELD